MVQLKDTDWIFLKNSIYMIPIRHTCKIQGHRKIENKNMDKDTKCKDMICLYYKKGSNL
jgi:hypothetical protein